MASPDGDRHRFAVLALVLAALAVSGGNVVT